MSYIRLPIGNKYSPERGGRHALKLVAMGSHTNTAANLASFETAQEVLCVSIAIQNKAQIEELSRPNPDAATLANIEHQLSLLMAAEDALSLDDPSGISKILNEYGPRVKAAFLSA